MLSAMKWLGEKKKVDLNWLEVWILLTLKAAGNWVGIEKIMAIIFLLERVYGLSKTQFVPSRIPWSNDVVDALSRLTSLGLVEASGSSYRLTEDGLKVVKRYPLSKVVYRYPFSCIQFFIDWDIDTLAEYIKANYPEWVT
jgi:hypothetical protein